MKGVPPTHLVLPARIEYEGRGAVIADQAGNEIHFVDRCSALLVFGALSELHRLNNEPPECDRPHCDEGACLVPEPVEAC